MEHGRRPVRAVHAKKSICWSRIELLHAGPEDTWLYEVLGFLQRGLTFSPTRTHLIAKQALPANRLCW